MSTPTSTPTPTTPHPGKGGRRGGVLYAHGSARPYHTNYTWIFQHLQSTPAPGKKSEGEGKMIKCLNRHLHHLSELILSEVPLRSRARYEAGERSRVQCWEVPVCTKLSCCSISICSLGICKLIWAVDHVNLYLTNIYYFCLKSLSLFNGLWPSASH